MDGGFLAGPRSMFNSLKSIMHKHSVNISERDHTYKVKYLGNVLISFMRGDGCVDRPLEILWKNYLNNEHSAFPMKLTICASGLKVETEDQGLTEYRWHRILFHTHHPSYPKLFVWVYKHEGRKMKIEQRCHAVLCKSEEKASTVNNQLQAKRNTAFMEYTREKMRSQNSRLALERSRAIPTHFIPKSCSKTTRTKFLSLGGNFKPPIEMSTGAPKLDSITEDDERCDDEEADKELLLYSYNVCHNHEVNMSTCEEVEDTTAVQNGFFQSPQQLNDPDRFSNESGFLEENDEHQRV